MIFFCDFHSLANIFIELEQICYQFNQSIASDCIFIKCIECNTEIKEVSYRGVIQQLTYMQVYDDTYFKCKFHILWIYTAVVDFMNI